VRPIPILQIINLLFGLLGLCWEWPLPLLTSASNKSHPQKPSSKLHNNTQKLPTASSPPSKLTITLSNFHSSIEARLLIYPLSTLAALLLYQGTNAGLYYIIGMCVYFWGFSEGEVVMGTPWTLPKKGGGWRARGASRV